MSRRYVAADRPIGHGLPAVVREHDAATVAVFWRGGGWQPQDATTTAEFDLLDGFRGDDCALALLLNRQVAR